MTHWFRRFAATTLLVFLAGSPALADQEHGKIQRTAATEDLFGYVPGAQMLEGQLLAPCCWNQTLDIHGSEVSNGLRREIRQRLLAGQDTDTVRADIVKRYGERILAVPPSSPLKSLAVVLSVVFGFAGVGAGMLVWRWRKRTEQNKPRNKPAAEGDGAARDEWDDRLETELEKLER